MVTDHLVKLHKEFDGVCQECSQRCDKSVISVKPKKGLEIIICPDCLAGRTKVVFQVSDQLVLNLQSILPRYSSADLKSLLLSFPHQSALVNHNPSFRIYWSWDKSQPFKTIHTNHQNQIKWITLHDNKLNKRFSTENKNKINGTQYIYSGQRTVPINLITISDEFQNTIPSSEKIEKQIAIYKEYGHFRGIKVERIGTMKWSLLDGYSRYCAAIQLGLTHVVTEELRCKNDQQPIPYKDETIFLTYTTLRKSKSSQEYSVNINIHRWNNAKIRKKFTLNFGSFLKYEDAVFAVNMIQHSFSKEEYYNQLEELTLPRLSVSYTGSSIMIKFGRKKTNTQNIGSWSEDNFTQLNEALNNCLKSPILIDHL
ncbi:hypothetical protein [Brevibacillus choshinensis]|uniref:hypothetical protein n=1 Tax=Brevibacillus choshinensis TaxID=54911 RepID=UPI002E1AC359|nr:hypothetical protein [Brevibacillus choshinensis]